MHATAKYVAFELQGEFPNTQKELLKLKGVGDYTASAIASISFNEPAAVVDGNVYRALSRAFGIDTPIDSSSGQKEFKALAQELIDKKDPATFNQALMEFGARQCKPKNPLCESCFFNSSCAALASGRITELPVKKGKTKVRKRFFNYLVLRAPEGGTLLNQRLEKGIWHKLYEFPNVETQQAATTQDIINASSFKDLIGRDKTAIPIRYNDDPILHKLSHQHLEITYWIVEAEVESKGLISADQIHDFPVPVVLERFINSYNF